MTPNRNKIHTIFFIVFQSLICIGVFLGECQVTLTRLGCCLDYTVTENLDDLAFACPRFLFEVDEQFLFRKSYVCSYNRDTRQPNWVAWHLTSSSVQGTLPLRETWHEDSSVPSPRQQLSDLAYSGLSRSCMCPPEDCRRDSIALNECYLLTNTCPQDHSLNIGLWSELERKCREWAEEYGDIYVVCGPVYKERNYRMAGKSGVAIPDGFFKVVLCLSGKPKGIGILVRNAEAPGRWSEYSVKINDVERITGIDFFPGLPDTLEEYVESRWDIRQWK